MSNGTTAPPPAASQLPSGFTPEAKAALEAAIVSGTLHVSYNGKSVTYRSLDELRLALTLVNQALTGGSIRTVLTRTRGDKGL